MNFILADSGGITSIVSQPDEKTLVSQPNETNH